MQNILNHNFNIPTLKFKPLFLCVSMVVGSTTVAQAEIVSTNGAGILNQGNSLPLFILINQAKAGSLIMCIVNLMLTKKALF